MDQRFPGAPTAPPPRWESIATALAALRRACPIDSMPALDGLTAGYADAVRQLGQAQLQRGDFAAAVAYAREALALRPDDPVLLNDLGNAFGRMGDLPSAIVAYRRATDRDPKSKALWYNLGFALMTHAKAEEAKTAFEAALACDPGYAEARGALGDVLNSLGDSEGAANCYRSCARERLHAPRAWSRIANLKTVRMSAADVSALRNLASAPGLNDKERVFVGFALSKALEDQGDYPAAFSILAESSRIKRSQVNWDARKYSQWVASIDAAFARPVAGARHPGFGHGVVFVAGMPRSGTSLIEQILASHPQVEGGGELTDLHAVIQEESKRRGVEFPSWVPAATPSDWQRLGENYLRRTQRWRQAHPHFTDKGLDNWPLIGAAAAMLPGARFVICRRDPLETCLSCYRQLFSFGNEATYDVNDLAAYWRDFDRLGRAWGERYPDRVFEAVHEALLADPDEQVRSLLASLGLPFDPACLAFHRTQRAVATFSSVQVRQPLQRDTARAPLYGALLDPMRAALKSNQAGRE